LSSNQSEEFEGKIIIQEGKINTSTESTAAQRELKRNTNSNSEKKRNKKIKYIF